MALAFYEQRLEELKLEEKQLINKRRMFGWLRFGCVACAAFIFYFSVCCFYFLFFLSQLAANPYLMLCASNSFSFSVVERYCQ